MKLSEARRLCEAATEDGFNKTRTPDVEADQCPVCYARKWEGHDEDCQLGRLVRRLAASRELVPELVGKLERAKQYMRHDPLHCDLSSYECTCGLDALLEEIDGRSEP